LPEDEQTSKHGGGGRYNVILEFRGANKKMRKRKKEKKKNMYEKRKKDRKRKKCEYE
jgi:hypothetical protein